MCSYKLHTCIHHKLGRSFSKVLAVERGTFRFHVFFSLVTLCPYFLHFCLILHQTSEHLPLHPAFHPAVPPSAPCYLARQSHPTEVTDSGWRFLHLLAPKKGHRINCVLAGCQQAGSEEEEEEEESELAALSAGKMELYLEESLDRSREE